MRLISTLTFECERLLGYLFTEMLHDHVAGFWNLGAAVRRHVYRVAGRFSRWPNVTDLTPSMIHQHDLNRIVRGIGELGRNFVAGNDLLAFEL